MAQFKVNPNTHAEQTIEAEFFLLREDYWYFHDASEDVVHVLSAKAVGEIERVRS